MKNIKPIVGYNTEFLTTPIIYGKEISLKLPNGEAHKAKFAIVELDNIIASHNEKTYSDSENYPLDANGENVNDRNYTGDISSQSKIIEFAQNLEPERLITTSRTPSGTPIITIDGIVISGNNRTMSIKLAVADYPEKYDEYKSFLLEESEAFGIHSHVVSQAISNDSIVDDRFRGETFRDNKYIKFKHPILVRIDYDFPEYTALELSKYNKDTKKSERPIDKALKLGKVLESSERCTSIISSIVGKYETFTELYANSADIKKIKESLITCNILTTQEIPAYFTEQGFTEQGKELIESLLAGLVLSKDALFASSEGGARSFRQTIITSLPVLTANKALGDESLNDALNEAVVMQSRMSNSKMTFQDTLAQSNMFGDSYSEKAMYLNRLLASGRNNFKKSIEAYNDSVVMNQGESLFGEKPSSNEIFEAHIKTKIAPTEKAAIEKKETKTETPIIESKAMVAESKTTLNPFVNGNFFKEHPDNVLAEKIVSQDRWKKTIVEYKGSIEDIGRIQAPINFITATISDQPLISVVNESVFTETETNSEVIDNLQKAIEISQSEEPKKVVRESKKKSKSLVIEGDTELTQQYTTKEVFDMINPEVSIEELRVFMWWKSKQGRPILTQEWLDLAEMDTNDLYNANDMLVRSWVQNGLLYYFDGELLPAYLYLAENVYDKKNRLVSVRETEDGEVKTSGQDAQYIIDNYGQEVFDNQLKALEEVFKIQYEKRLLLLGSDRADGLIISPISKFAKTFMIKSLVDEAPFRWKKITAGSNKQFGKPNFLETYVADRDKALFEELSLTDAYCYWLRTDDTIMYQKGMNYADIIKIYIQAANKPASQAAKDENGYYIGEQLTLKKKEDAEWERIKSKAKSEGDRLFLVFMEKFLTANDKVKVEMQWNRDYNGYVKINYNKVPVAFPCNRFDMGKPMEIKPEKREAVAFTFSEGSSLLAYDVGVGKTPSAIFTISQFLSTGYAKRPVFVVPNQTYKQWISEFGKFAGHIRLNEFYNLSKEYIDEWKDVNGVTKLVAEGSVSIITYEGMKQIGFREETVKQLTPELSAILMQNNTDGLSEKKQDREIEKLNSKVEEIIGKALSKSIINIEDLGFDFILFDEAHACKKVFTFVKGEKEENLGNSGKDTKSISRYQIKSGEPSFNGVKGFMLCHYIQKRYNGNTLLLTATPFTNSPLEIYSMLAMVARKKLQQMGLDNLATFFDTYVNISYEMIINSRLKPERRQVILGFNNLISLQTLVRRFINYKTGEEVHVPRPNKIVLPLRSKLIDGIKVELSDEEKVETILPLTSLQSELMSQIKLYAEGEVTEAEMCNASLVESEENEDEAKAEGVEIDEDSMDADEKVGVRLLKAMNHARNVALSPYIFDCSGLGTPDAEKYINTSNKLKYVIESIRTIKDWHKEHGSDMSGVVIYMDRGVEYFHLIRKYLIDNVGFAEHEVGIISSKLIVPVPKGTPKDEQKEYVKNLFLGDRFNKDTLVMEQLKPSERCKVLIGSSTIKEGINLQKHSSVLFNCWMDWNPTDIQQLEGRIYRQGNKFKTVRIVNPLMIDSMDIFMFQKLEEKTSRINTIWQNDGRTNVLKTEEFNPKELKYSLIKDPTVLAEMELLEIGEKIDEDIIDAENKIKRNEKILGYEATISSYTKRLEDWLEDYRPLAEGQSQRGLDAMLRLAQEVLKNQTDSQGKKMEYSYARDSKKPEGYYSKLYPASKQYWYDDLNFANRNLRREERDYLAPKGLSIKDLTSYSDKLRLEIEQLKKDKEGAVSPEAIKIKAGQIQEEREANKIEEKTVGQSVEEFKRLNYLLGELVSPDKKIEIVTQCPPLDENGKVRIDEEGLKLLDICCENAPDTKRMNSIEVINDNGDKTLVYTPEREALHKKIVQQMTSKAVCIERGQPIAVLMGGSPASGKSTFLKKFAPYLTSDLLWKVDADAVREYLPEYEGWNASATHLETQDVVKKLISSFDIPCKHDFIFDGTMSNSSKYIALIAQLKKIGYAIYIIYMDAPKEVTVQRSLQRYLNNNGGKAKYGRYVPKYIIDDFYNTGKAGLNEIKGSVDGYIVVDSITQEITESGGVDIPTNRDYSVLFKKEKQPKAKPIVKEVDSEKEALIKNIEMVRELLDITEGKERLEVLKNIEMMEELLEFQ
jgi:predicted ABC-type ATPase